MCVGVICGFIEVDIALFGIIVVVEVLAKFPHDTIPRTLPQIVGWTAPDGWISGAQGVGRVVAENGCER